DVARHVDAERGVRDALREDREHDETRHDERAVAHTFDLRDARADRRAEDDEVERRRDDGRQETLHERAKPARELEAINGADGVDVHAAPRTRFTKISSSELSSVRKSRNSMPSSLSSRRSDAMPVASLCASNV